MREWALLNRSTHEPSSWLTGPVYFLMQHARGVNSPSLIAGRALGCSCRWVGEKGERGKGRMRKDWSGREMVEAFSQTVGLCQHPCMVAKGTSLFVLKSLSHWLFSFHTHSASVISFSPSALRLLLSLAGRRGQWNEIQWCPELENEFNQSLSVRERKREEEKGELLNGRRSQLSVIQGPVIYPTEDE